MHTVSPVQPASVCVAPLGWASHSAPSGGVAKEAAAPWKGKRESHLQHTHTFACLYTYSSSHARSFHVYILVPIYILIILNVHTHASHIHSRSRSFLSHPDSSRRESLASDAPKGRRAHLRERGRQGEGGGSLASLCTRCSERGFLKRLSRGEGEGRLQGEDEGGSRHCILSDS